MLYKMNFSHLSGEGGASILLNPREKESPINQIDVLGLDNEIAIAIECKSSENISKRPLFQGELAKHASIRERFSYASKEQYPIEPKRTIILAMFLSNILLSSNDILRAKEAQVVIFDEEDLSYYEDLISHIGPAAKYQFFADILPGKEIPGLSITVPAVKTKMGGANCYTFSISPEYLLKISYVSHRAKGKAFDIDTYQRMLKKSRLKSIRQYISNNGIFPTNIVVNLESDRLNFERTQQESDQEFGVLGWLHIKPAYKSAWIIDGQHRLFAYSGHEKASKDRLSVLAFEWLPASKQAQYFIDINAEQKSVKQDLLVDLFAELNWDAEQPRIRIGAIISKAIQFLGKDSESPFYQRIQRPDTPRDALRCISSTSLFRALEKTDLFIAKERRGRIVDYGPLWAGDNFDTLKRTVFILKHWFDTIKNNANTSAWWDIGRAEGGGLAMNDGVIICIKVLYSVFRHLSEKGIQLNHLDNDDLFEFIKEYGLIVGDYLGSLSEEERKQFRSLRASEGQTTGMRRCQKAIHDKIPLFRPFGLEKFLEEDKMQTNNKAKKVVDRIETNLHKAIIEELRREIGHDESQWWMLGVPKSVRLKVGKRYDEDDGKRGGKEYYFDLIDYRDIIVDNWSTFEPIFAYGKGNKDKRTSWIVYVNDKRRIVSHASSGVNVSLEELNQLQIYDKWLTDQIYGIHNTDNADLSDD